MTDEQKTTNALARSLSNAGLGIASILRQKTCGEISCDQCNVERDLAADEIEHHAHRAEVLAATIRAITEVVTIDCESKADFIARVRRILKEDPDARVLPNV